MYYVYVLQSLKNKSLYTGFTSSVKKRLICHNNGLNVSTVKFRPWKLIYFESYIIKEDALNRERFLKTGRGKAYLDHQLKGYFLKYPRKKIVKST